MSLRRGLWGIGFGAILVMVVWAFGLILRSPCLGVADNLDYWRVMRPAGIAHLGDVERPGQFVQCTYSTSDADLMSGLSSPAIMAWVARHMRWGLSEDAGRMNLRQVGVAYLVLVVLVFALGLWAGLPLLLSIGFLMIVVDPGYLLFFNSFYADPALIVGLLGTTVWFVRADQGIWRSGDGFVGRVGEALALVALAMFGGGGKMKYVLLPALVLIAGLTLVPFRPDQDRTPRRTRLISALLGVLAGVAVVVPLHFFQGDAPRFVRVNNYHALYGGLLKVSSHPDAVLESLEIPPEDWNLPRRDVWSGRVPLDHPVFERLDNLSRWRLLLFYAEDPAALKAVGTKVMHELARYQSHTRGTFVQGEEHPRKAQFDTRWRAAHLRNLVLARFPQIIWLMLLAGSVWLGWSATRGRWDGRRAAALFLILFATSQMVVVVLGDGFVALEQHLLGARLAIDLLTVLLLWVGLGEPVCGRYLSDAATKAVAEVSVSRNPPLSN